MSNKFDLFALFIKLFVIGIIVGGCDNTSSGGSGSVSLLRGEPVILDSTLAINVSDDRPDGIADTFFDTSDRIYLWIFWVNVEGRHTVEVNWFSPQNEIGDSPFLADQETFTSSTGDQITWFFIDAPLGGFSDGEWFVEIFLDGLFERSHIFDVR